MKWKTDEKSLQRKNYYGHTNSLIENPLIKGIVTTIYNSQNLYSLNSIQLLQMLHSCAFLP